VPIERKIYYCQHCQRRRLMDRRKIEKHEAECWSNPDNKSCPSCLFSFSEYEKDETTGKMKRVFGCYVDPDHRREFGEQPPVGCEKWVHLDSPYIDEDETQEDIIEVFRREAMRG